jgi:hypothetical protein
MHFYVPRSKNAAQHVLSMPSSRKISVDSFSPFLSYINYIVSSAHRVCVRVSARVTSAAAPMDAKKTQQKAKKKSRHGAFFAMRSKKASFPPDASESLSCSPAKCADENAKEENEKLQNSNQLISGSFYLSLSLHPLRLRAHTFRPKGTV